MVDFNPFLAEFRADPYPVYARMREEAPVLLTSMNSWAVSRYDDVCYVLKNPQLFSSTAMGAAAMGPNNQPIRSVINTDPPDHTYIRNLVNRAFTPRMVAEMEPRIREISRELLRRVVETGEMDLVTDLATPLPVTVIAEILGVEAERRHDFKRWSNAMVGGTGTAQSFDDVTQRGKDAEEFRAYFAEAIEERRKSPRNDLISALIAADEQDKRLTAEEIVAFTMLLLVAGNETTTNLIGNAMLALTEHPDQLERVQTDAALIPNMVEEALRYDSPVQFLFRAATQDTEIAGTAVPQGNIVVPLYASGNRDDRRYPDAARFDIARNAQGHLAFGLGPHFCLGAPLARLEAKVAFEELFARTRKIERSGDTQRLDSIFLRGMKSLPLRFEPVVVAAMPA